MRLLTIFTKSRASRPKVEDTPPARKPSYAYAVLNCRANGGPYYGDLLRPYAWSWPSDTWLKATLRMARNGHRK